MEDPSPGSNRNLQRPVHQQLTCGSRSAHEKIVKSAFANAPDKAQIKVAGADHLDRKIRVDNTLIIKAGKEVSLKLGAQVEGKRQANHILGAAEFLC